MNASRIHNVTWRVAMALVIAGSLLAGCATVTPVTPVPAPAPAEPVTPQAVPESAPAPSLAAQTAPEAAPQVQVSLQEFVERNDDRLLQAYVGMSRQGVERLMSGLHAGSYSNPFRQQSISLAHGKRYDVLYYLTRAPRAGHGITETMLTPVILKNDRVVAIGRYPLKKLRRGECPASKPSACE